MPDFLSRLVERTFGLVAVAQPVTHSIFAPDHPVKSDYIQSFAHDSESMGNQNGVNIDGSRKNRIIPQNNYHPLLNPKKPSNEDDAKLTSQIKDQDNRIYFASTSIQPHNIESLKQNDSGFQEQIASMPLQQMSEQDNRYRHKPAAGLAQNNGPLYTVDSDTLESVEPELLHAKNRNGQSSLRLVSKSILREEQFHDDEQDSEKHLEPFVDSVTSLSGKTLMDRISDSSLTSGSSSSLENGKFFVPNREQTSRVDSYSPNYLHSDARLSPIIDSKQNFKQVSTQKGNVTLEQRGNMLIEQHVVAPRSPSTVPTIKVTIGRIEVKAVKPPQEPQPQTPPPRQYPTLSLDDYLKQHSG